MLSTDLYTWAGLMGSLMAFVMVFQTPGDNSGSEMIDGDRAITKPEQVQFVTNNYVITPNSRKRANPPQAKPDPKVTPAINPVVNYFKEIALGGEWGDTEPCIRRWHRTEISLGVRGNPTDSDWQVLRQVAAELSDLTGMALKLAEFEGAEAASPDIEIHFRPEAEFPALLPTYQPGNKGFFWVWWSETSIEQAKILIASAGITPDERAHLIREELTQSLGLMQDSWAQADSIFYQGWTATLEYSAIDQAIIQLLYQPQIRAGMTQTEVDQMLAQLQ
jgi:hypothetical protein